MKEYTSPKIDILYVGSSDIMAMSRNGLVDDKDYMSQSASDLEF
jgi:hypothetical protein